MPGKEYVVHPRHRCLEHAELVAKLPYTVVSQKGYGTGETVSSDRHNRKSRSPRSACREADYLEIFESPDDLLARLPSPSQRNKEALA